MSMAYIEPHFIHGLEQFFRQVHDGAGGPGCGLVEPIEHFCLLRRQPRIGLEHLLWQRPRQDQISKPGSGAIILQELKTPHRQHAHNHVTCYIQSLYERMNIVQTFPSPGAASCEKLNRLFESSDATTSCPVCCSADMLLRSHERIRELNRDMQ